MLGIQNYCGQFFSPYIISELLILLSAFTQRTILLEFGMWDDATGTATVAPPSAGTASAAPTEAGSTDAVANAADDSGAMIKAESSMAPSVRCRCWSCRGRWTLTASWTLVLLAGVRGGLLRRLGRRERTTCARWKRESTKANRSRPTTRRRMPPPRSRCQVCGCVSVPVSARVFVGGGAPVRHATAGSLSLVRAGYGIPVCSDRIQPS